MNSITTKIYAADVTELEDEALYKAAYCTVTKARQKRTDSLCFKRDRQLSIGAELLLMYGLNNLDINLRKMVYYYGEHGKPYLKGSQNVFFNISHSGQFVVCAISSKEIGCDIEKISDINLRIAKRFFSRTEYEIIANQKTEEARREMFFRLWTLKESFIKFTGLGMSLPMNEFSIIFDRNGILAEHKLNCKSCYFQEISLWEDYKCSVCGMDMEIGSKKGVPVEMINFLEMLETDGGCLTDENNVQI